MSYRAFILLPVCCLATACSTLSTVESAQRQAVRYNAAFTNARNEILLLNILRAKHGDPLQFSTMSNVTGSMRGNIMVTNPIEWAFSGAEKMAKLASGGTAFTFRDPTVTVEPLDSKEFWQGMTSPISPEYLAELLKQHDDESIVKNLVIVGQGCASSRVEESPLRDVWMAASDAVKLLASGAGDDIDVILLSSPATEQPDKLRLRFTPKNDVIKVDKTICSGGYFDTKVARLRSPIEMIRFLAKSEDFQISEAMPTNGALVSTMYNGHIHYLAAKPSSASTLSLLAQIIAFQTTSAELNASKPSLTVSADGG